jgi:hypothetical protein
VYSESTSASSITASKATQPGQHGSQSGPIDSYEPDGLPGPSRALRYEIEVVVVFDARERSVQEFAIAIAG